MVSKVKNNSIKDILKINRFESPHPKQVISGTFYAQSPNPLNSMSAVGSQELGIKVNSKISKKLIVTKKYFRKT